MPNIIETSDAAAGTSTAYSLGIGQTAQGQLSANGDHDWFRVDLVAGQTYTFAMTGTGTNNVQDPYLRLYAANGSTLLAFNDDGLQGLNSIFTFTAATTGTHYLDAGAFNNGGSGQYGLSATAGSRASFDLQMGAGVIDTDLSWSVTPGTGATVTWAPRATYAGATDAQGNPVAFAQLSAAEIAATQTALAMYSDVCGLTFTQVNPGGYSDNATILLSNYYSTTDGAGAYASYPGSTASGSSAGDVRLNTASVSEASLPFGSYSYFALIHEIGHALGLSHPGVYNAAPGVSITYAANAQFAQDTHQYSVMSYFDESYTTGTGWASYPDTMMILDINALQQIYGANTATRAGDSIYGFGSNVGSIYDFAVNTNPALCIWDGAGTDTLSCSGFSQAQVINLNAGAFSNIGGLIGNVSIALGATMENATGGSGNDAITGNAVANQLDGGGANDALNGGDSFGLTAHGGSVLRLYQATLDRNPDVSGFNNWVAGLDSGTPLVSITSGFVNSLEFQQTYGALNNTQFVTLLYNNVLDRAPDAPGLANWVAALNGGASRESVVNGFSESQEFIANTEFDVGAFSTVPLNGAVFGQVFRLYQATLDRAPDAGGLENWTNARVAGTSLDTVTSGFVNSVEFQQTYGALNNTQFVTLLYNNVLDRAPDAPGLANWVNALNAGASRTSVVNGFSESQEFINNTDPALTSFMRSSLPNWADAIVGGAGDDRMIGGRGSDTFVFNANAVGADQVYGLERWDQVQFSNFGYTTDSQAISHMAQSGADVVFADQGETITFLDTQLSMLSQIHYLL